MQVQLPPALRKSGESHILPDPIHSGLHQARQTLPKARRTYSVRALPPARETIIIRWSIVYAAHINILQAVSSFYFSVVICVALCWSALELIVAHLPFDNKSVVMVTVHIQT